MKIAINEVHLWHTELNIVEDQLQKHLSILNSAELARADRFYFPLHRNRFIASHSFLRFALSEYLNMSPSDIELAIDDNGKPYLPNQTLQFNLSHSKNLAALAIAPNIAIGLDVEFIKQTFDITLAEHHYHADEYSALKNQLPAQQAAYFYKIWARKEALIKANGKGLSLPLNQFSTHSSNNPEVILLEDKRWHLYSVDIHPDYAAALATSQKILELIYWQWDGNHTRLVDSNTAQ